MEISFKPRTSHRAVWTFYAVFAFFLIMFLLFLPIEEEPMLILVYLFIFLMFAIVFVQASALPYGYFVDDNGLTVRHYKRKLIPFDQIKVIRKINQESTAMLLESVSRKESAASNAVDIVGAFKGRILFGKLVQYCSYQIVSQDSRVGKKITSVKSHTKGDFVLIVTKTEDVFLLSPQNVEGLVDEVDKHLKEKED